MIKFVDVAFIWLDNFWIKRSSIITCPKCEQRQKEILPTGGCEIIYQCSNCKVILEPIGDDCCVYCSYGTNPCPPIQKQQRKLFPKTIFVALAAAISTIFCCLPVLLMMLGFGTIGMALYQDIPFLRWFQFNPNYVFSIAIGLLMLSSYLAFRCDQKCDLSTKLRKRKLVISWLIIIAVILLINYWLVYWAF